MERTTGGSVRKARILNRAKEDLEDAARDLGVAVEIRSQALRDREHPLPDREPGQDSISEVSGDLRHPARVAGGAHAPALVAEGNESLVAASVTAGAGKAVRDEQGREAGRVATGTRPTPGDRGSRSRRPNPP